MDKRIKFFGLFLVLGLVAVLVRLFYWQIIKGKSLTALARSQYVSIKDTQGKRGSILDHNKEYIVSSDDAWLLYANPTELDMSPKKVANLLADLFVNEDAENYKEELTTETLNIEGTLERQKVVWVPIKHKLNLETKQKIEDLAIKGLGFQLEETRVYPEGSSSAHILGFIGKNDEGDDVGYFGLEGYYDLILSSTPGFVEHEADALGSPILSGFSKQVLTGGGVDLITHLDKSIQFTAEEKLKKGIEKYGAKSGTIIIMRPEDGAILSMASWPAYDPEKYYEYGDIYFKNPSISNTFEPGSIFKPIVMASGLDAGVIKPDTKCDICDQPLKVDKYFIKTWNNEYHKDASMVDVIRTSDNVGMAFVAQKLGSDKLYDYLEKFGFGDLTGLDLQGEVALNLRAKGTWNIVDLSTTAFGQGIAVTPIQMVQALGVIANNGIMVHPQVVDKVASDDWEQDINPSVAGRVISEKAAKEITSMMVTAIKDGEAKWIAPKGYSIAGKTGTAQIPVAGHYDDEKTIASFIGFAPSSDPKFVMLVTLQEPQSSPWASETAAPLWFEVALDIFPKLGVKPEN